MTANVGQRRALESHLNGIAVCSIVIEGHATHDRIVGKAVEQGLDAGFRATQKGNKRAQATRVEQGEKARCKTFITRCVGKRHDAHKMISTAGAGKG